MKINKICRPAFPFNMRVLSEKLRASAMFDKDIIY